MNIHYISEKDITSEMLENANPGQDILDASYAGSLKSYFWTSISDDYKTLNGFRPRWNFTTWSVEALLAFKLNLEEEVHLAIEDDFIAGQQHEAAVEAAMTPKNLPIGDIFGHINLTSPPPETK